MYKERLINSIQSLTFAIILSLIVFVAMSALHSVKKTARDKIFNKKEKKNEVQKTDTVYIYVQKDSINLN